MKIIVLGINHKTTDIELREKFSFSREELALKLASIKNDPTIREVVILSTCNRTEIYAYASSITVLQSFFDGINLELHGYYFEGIKAAEHLMHVACGLDSLVIGEPEIFGQVKSAFSFACLHQTVGRYLSQLFRLTFHVTKQIRSSTKIGACPISVGSTAVRYAQEWLGDKGDPPRLLIIGSGTIGRIVAKHAQSLTPTRLYVMSRQFSNAEHLAHEVGGLAVELSQLLDYLPQVDVVISATASKTALISEDHVKQICHPLLMMDLAVPRDISPDVKNNNNIHLCLLDDLKMIIQRHVHLRSHAASQAEKLIEEYAREFILTLRVFDSEEIIKSYRLMMEKQSEEELAKILQKELSSQNIEAILRNFSKNLLNKIMHFPSTQLRKASREGRYEVLHSAAEILGLTEKRDL